MKKSDMPSEDTLTSGHEDKIRELILTLKAVDMARTRYI